ncbi:hypothetical protein ACFWA5_13580 [Streptomyces mirabilis]|uniref:hypothetical protein n=1 Tax=Streptomyces mirabilis TaxID=68239 RepID=UPI0036599DE3
MRSLAAVIGAASAGGQSSQPMRSAGARDLLTVPMETTRSADRVPQLPFELGAQLLAALPVDGQEQFG